MFIVVFVCGFLIGVGLAYLKWRCNPYECITPHDYMGEEEMMMIGNIEGEEYCTCSKCDKMVDVDGKGTYIVKGGNENA